MNARNTGGDYVAAYFDDRNQAEQAIRELRDNGFSARQIGTNMSSVSMESEAASSGSQERGFWDKVEEFFSGDDSRDSESDQYRTDPEMRTVSVPEQYRQGVNQGGAWIAVFDNQRVELARSILSSQGGKIDTSADMTDTAATTGQSSEEDRIQLISEVLQVRKERVNTGEVRLRKEVITEQQNIDVPVTREEIVIERVGAEGRTPTGELGSDQEIRVPVSEERVRVDKKPVVNEEVRVSKKRREDVQHVSDEVRREELQVDTDGDVSEIKPPKRRDVA